MQLDLAAPDNDNDDEMMDPVELILLPPTQSPSATTTEEPIKALFAAVSACSNLHPDVLDEDEDMDGSDRIVFEGSVGYEGISGLPGVMSLPDDGGLPPPFPGSGGWITAENVREFFTPEGEYLGRQGNISEMVERLQKEENNERTEEQDNDQRTKRPRVE
jgi:nucleotide-sensitive chloride channel 1A